MVLEKSQRSVNQNTMHTIIFNDSEDDDDDDDIGV